MTNFLSDLLLVQPLQPWNLDQRPSLKLFQFFRFTASIPKRKLIHFFSNTTDSLFEFKPLFLEEHSQTCHLWGVFARDIVRIRWIREFFRDTVIKQSAGILGLFTCCKLDEAKAFWLAVWVFWHFNEANSTGPLENVRNLIRCQLLWETFNVNCGSVHWGSV